MKSIIGVIGGSSCTKEEAALAEETGRLLAQRGAVLVCGGLGGVMEAVARGAHALIAIGGGVGTLSEIALAQRIGKPVVGLHDSFRNALDIPRLESANDAVQWAVERAQNGVV